VGFVFHSKSVSDCPNGFPCNSPETELCLENATTGGTAGILTTPVVDFGMAGEPNGLDLGTLGMCCETPLGLDGVLASPKGFV
jgi:hypothetical protein